MYLRMQNTGCMDPALWNLNFRVQFKITTNGECPLNFKWSVAYQCKKKFFKLEMKPEIENIPQEI